MKFWAQDIRATAAYCAANLPQDAQQAIRQADDICNNTFLFSDHWEMERTQQPVHFDGAIDLAFIPKDDPEWLYAMNRHTSFVNLGKAYALTGDEKYARHFAYLIGDWIDRVPLTEESSGNTWRSLESGLRCEFWLRAMQLFRGSSVMTESLLTKIEGSLREHGVYLADTHTDFHRQSNWGVLQDHGLYLLGVYFDSAAWRKLAAERLTENLYLQVMRDGSHWEQSPMYHCEVLHCAIDTLTIAVQNGFTLPESFVQRTHDMCTALAKWLKPNGRLVCQSDSDDTDARDIVAQGALLFDDATLKFAAGETLFAENLWDFGTACVQKYAHLSAQAPAIASTALPDSGNYMLRSDTSASAAFLHMHCGCLGSGHGHADLLHLDISANGEDILIDSGRYTYVNTPLRRALKLAAAHNTTRVDGEDFSECIDSWGYSKLAQPIKGEHTFTKTADYLSGAHLGYMHKGIFTQRKVVFVKPDIFVVFDQFFAIGKHAYEQNFHFGAGALSLQNNTAVWQGEKTAAQVHFAGEVSVQTARAPYSQDYNALCEGDVIRVTKTADGFASFVTVISVGDAAITAEKVPVTSLRFDRGYTDAQAEAVVITKEGREITVLVSHAEVISEVDLLCANGYNGYGKAIVFTTQNPQGVCLAW